MGGLSDKVGAEQDILDSLTVNVTARTHQVRDLGDPTYFLSAELSCVEMRPNVSRTDQEGLDLVAVDDIRATLATFAERQRRMEQRITMFRERKTSTTRLTDSLADASELLDEMLARPRPTPPHPDVARRRKDVAADDVVVGGYNDNSVASGPLSEVFAADAHRMCTWSNTTAARAPTRLDMLVPLAADARRASLSRGAAPADTTL